MADIKISGMTAAAAATGSMELEVNDGGATKKVTVTQIQDKMMGTTGGLIVRTGSGTTAARTVTGGRGTTVSNGTGVAGNPTVEIGDDAFLIAYAFNLHLGS